MENMDKGLPIPKWVLIFWPKIPQMPQNLFAHFVCPGPKVLDFNEKRLHWASVVRDVKCPGLRLKTTYFFYSRLLNIDRTYVYYFEFFHRPDAFISMPYKKILSLIFVFEFLFAR